MTLVNLFSAAAFGILALSLVLIYRKLVALATELKDTRRNLRVDIEKAELRLYRQLESLQALTSLLGLRQPLPPLRDWAGSPDFLLELCREALARVPGRIVECSSGVSTLVIARCCQLNNHGHVYSLENSAEFAQKTRTMLERAGLQDWATVVEAPLKPYSFEGESYSWYTIDDLPSERIDLLVVDGPLGKLNPLARYPAGPILFPRLSDNALIIVDDANRPDERRIIERWHKQFPRFGVERREAEKGLALLEAAS